MEDLSTVSDPPLPRQVLALHLVLTRDPDPGNPAPDSTLDYRDRPPLRKPPAILPFSSHPMYMPGRPRNGMQPGEALHEHASPPVFGRLGPSSG